MKKKTSEIHISWGQFEKLAAQLARKIKASGFKPDYVVGIAMGGLIPLALVAERLNVMCRNGIRTLIRRKDQEAREARHITSASDKGAGQEDSPHRRDRRHGGDLQGRIEGLERRVRSKAY